VIQGYGQPEQTTATMIYDTAGNLLSETTGQAGTATYAHQATVSYGYDALNRQTTEIDGYGSGAAQRTVTTVYDAAGNVQARIDALGNATTMVYDSLNREVSSKDPLGHVGTTVYDAAGNVINTIDANGDTSTFGFDALNRQTTATDPRGGVTTTNFDAQGNQLTLTDSDGNTTTMAYDSLNRLTQQTDPLNHSATFAFDAGSRMTSTTDRDGRVRNFTYDALNRETGQTWVVSGSTVNTQTFTYDAQGNQLTAADTNGTYTMAFDSLNRTTTEQEPFGQTLTFTWDAASNRYVLQDSLGGTTTSTYDALDRLTERQFGGSGQTPLHANLTWTARDQLSTVTRYDDQAGGTLAATSTYQYDAAMRLTNLQHTDSAGANVGSYVYAYDPGNRLTSETDNGTTTSYQYDAGSELTQAGSVTYGYDATGNRKNTGYTTGTGNELTNDGAWTYTYDNEGNLTKKSKGASAETWTYGYDSLNHLVSAKDASTDGGTTLTLVTYVYDVHGNRIEEDAWTQSGGTTTVSRYAYDGLNVWADLNASNALVMRRLYLDGVDQPFARIDSSGTAAWYLPDHLGSERDIENYAGTMVLDHMDYDAYGNITNETNPANGDPYKYAGGVYDSYTGLEQFGERWYDPKSGRWTTQDPLGFGGGDDNVYRYVGNSPTNQTDPLGLAVCVKKITVTDQGKGLGLIISDTQFAFGFKVRIEATVDGEDDITKATIVQEIYQLGYAKVRPKPKKADATDLYTVMDAGHPKGVLVDEKTWKRDWNLWNDGNPPYGKDLENDDLFDPEPAWVTKGKDWVEYTDEPGWPGGRDSGNIFAEDYSRAELYAEFKITAKGTDKKAVVANFWYSMTADSDGRDWKIDKKPRPSPPLPKSWP
jgi:RHS repeat-associated protein